MGCPCEVTLAFMTRIGCIHAARMHGMSAGVMPGEWTSRDWTMHIEEEDRFLRPLLDEHVPVCVCLYDEDHRVFREELARFGKIVSVERIASHSALEDWACSLLIEMGF